MNEIKFIPLKTAPPSDGKTEIIDVHYDLEKLIITVGLFENKIDKQVIFNNVTGFRALDESDLFAWWKNLNMNKGWAFEIIEGGWFELESQRGDFMSQGCDFYREFLIIGNDLCINIISTDAPKIFNSMRS